MHRRPKTPDIVHPAGVDLRRRFGTIVTAGALALALMMLTAAWFATRIDATWTRIDQTVGAKNAALTDLVAAVGYGGLIHDVRDHALRGQPRHTNTSAWAIASVRSAVARYRGLAGLTPDEATALGVIAQSVDGYEEALAGLGPVTDWVPSDLDAVRVIDGQLALAVMTLRSSVENERLEAQRDFHSELVLAIGAGLGVGITGLLVVIVGGRRVLDRQANAVEHAFASLQHAEAVLRETGRAAKIGGWMLDLETMKPMWSREVRRIHDVDDDYEPNIETAINFYAPEARSLIEHAVNNGIATGAAWDLEVPFITATGRRIWVRAIGRPEMVNGTCVKLWGAFQDITETVHARQEIEDLQARFERAIGGTSDGLWEFDLVDKRAWYSDQFQRLIGLDDETFACLNNTPEAYLSLLHPDDARDVRKALDADGGGDDRFDVEHRVRVAGGSYRWFRVRGSRTRDDSGRVTRMSGTLTDIHERRLAVGRLDLATRAARIGLWDWDVPSGDVHMNEMYFGMLGYEPGELAHTVDTFKRLLHPDDMDAAFAEVARHFGGESDWYAVDIRLKRKSGEWSWVRAIGELIERGEDGTPKRMIGVHVDIDEARRALAEAEAANRAKTEFLANMSHEIRTPMTAILGYADLLTGDLQGDAEATAELVKTISANANHLMVVINDVLDVSKIEAGQMSLELIDTRIADVVDQVVSLAQPRAAQRQLAFHVACDPGVPYRVRTDPTRLKQVLMNLSSNALKFTERGEVSLSISYAESSETLVIRVSDTGIGMTPEERGRVARFEAFTQADASTTRRFGGSGLGLRISNALAQMMGGGIEVESEEGVGSTFTVRVHAPPAGDADTMSTTASRSPANGDTATARPLDGLRIVLAEDGPDNQRLIAFYLEKAGAEVLICENGLEAVRVFEDASEPDPPDLVLMDMQMPVMDGYSATARIRSMGVSVPIVAITAHAMDDDRAKCLDAGCDEYVAKPIDRAKLIAACARLAGNGERRGAA